MREYQRKKKKIHRFLYSRLAFGILIVLTLFIGKATWNVYTKEQESEKNLKRATEELASLEARQAQLSQKIDRLKTTEGMEAEIREQFQVAKPGEKMVVIAEGKRDTPKEEPEQSLVSKFFNLFR